MDADGTVYFVYQAEDRTTEVTDPADKVGNTHPKVAVSHDKGLTWQPSIDVGASVINGGPIKNATFVTATAGSSGRAAVAFFGTETGGNNWACGEGDDCSGDTGLFPRDSFTGVWYLYISVTYDGGKTWTTQNVTPGDPSSEVAFAAGGPAETCSISWMFRSTRKVGFWSGARTVVSAPACRVGGIAFRRKALSCGNPAANA
jgi:hypothetical protein